MEREVSVSRFKATCLKLFDEIATTGAEFVVTKRGEPVARVGPAEAAEDVRARLRADLRGSVTYLVDDDELLEPVDVEWRAVR